VSYDKAGRNLEQDSGNRLIRQLDQAAEGLHRRPGQGFSRHANRGQRRRGKFRKKDVVESHNGHAARQVDAAAIQFSFRAESHHVVGANRGRGQSPLAKNLLHRLHPAFHSVIAFNQPALPANTVRLSNGGKKSLTAQPG
jgi:hypothetical protein